MIKRRASLGKIDDLQVSKDFDFSFEESEVPASKSKLDNFDEIDFEEPAFMRNNKD